MFFFARYDTIAEGIGNDHVTGNFGKAILDDAFRVSDQEAVYMAHYLLKNEGELGELYYSYYNNFVLDTPGVASLRAYLDKWSRIDVSTPRSSPRCTSYVVANTARRRALLTAPS